MMKCKVINLEAYRKFRPIKLKMKIVKKKYNDIKLKLKEIFID